MGDISKVASYLGLSGIQSPHFGGLCLSYAAHGHGRKS